MRLSISQETYCYFKRWLIEEEKVKMLPCLGEYEMARWEPNKKGEPMPIIFKRIRTDRLTLNISAFKYYQKYCVMAMSNMMNDLGTKNGNQIR